MSITLLLAMTMTVAAGSAQARAAQTGPVTPAPPTAQADARFAHWLGCWRLEDDLAGTGVRVCILPDQQAGVKLQTLFGIQRGTDEVIVPDGVARPILDVECNGTERSEWSRDGLRVFRFTDVTCGKEPPRKVSGVAFLAAGPAWVNVQYVEGGPNTSVRVQRYRRAVDQTLADGSKAPQPSARALAQAPARTDLDWNVDDVIEASAKLPADAVQAAISEFRGPFQLNKTSLVAMDEANVPERVIDLMIALTYPRRFVVQRAGGGGFALPMGLSMGGGWYDPFMALLGHGSMFDCYSPFGLGYSSYYSSCGSNYSSYGSPYGSPYGYLYGNNNYYPGYNTGGWVVVDANPSQPPTQQVEGRAVNGRGYTQVRPRETEPSPVRQGSIGNGAAHGDGGSSSGVSSQGYSSGSSGGSSGSSSGGGDRTAVPRPPGGQ